MRKILLIICLIQYFTLSASEYRSIVFSEIMADPEPSVGLPEVEYIELHNRTGETIPLSGWVLYGGDKAYPFPVCSIKPDCYLVLCPKSGSSLFSKDIDLAVFNSFPALSNTGKMMYIVSAQGNLAACLEYDNSWYDSGFKSQGGWSLECIDTENLSGAIDNWTASRDSTGGTPGRLNSVSASNPDLGLPVCNRLYVLLSGKIELQFSKKMDPNWLSDENSFFFPNANNIVTQTDPEFPTYRGTTLSLSDELLPGTIYEMVLRNMQDISGNIASDTSIFFALPLPPDSFCLSMNEIMFNPMPSGCDYVEFVNRSGKCVDLSDVWISNRDEAGTLNEGWRLSVKPLPCLPGSYWLLSVNTDSVCTQNSCNGAPNHIDMNGMPSMPDDAGNVVLLTTSDIIDEVQYEDDMHFVLMSNAEGVSLEKFNPEMSSVQKESWISASSASGYGTPGYRNSQYHEFIAEEHEEFVFTDNNWLSPDNDGQNDAVCITVRPPEPGMVNLTVFDLGGRVVRTLINNRYVGAEEQSIWGGTSDSGNLVKFGKYVVFAEYFSPDGLCLKKRFVLSVLMKD